jgi:hypothetical protein
MFTIIQNAPAGPREALPVSGMVCGLPVAASAMLTVAV